MGSAHSYVTEATLATFVVSAVVVYNYTHTQHISQKPQDSVPAPTDGGKVAKKRQGTRSAASDKLSPNVTVVPFPAIIPGDFDASSALPNTEATPDPPSKSAKSTKKKKGKKTGASGAGASRPVDAMSESSATAPETSVSAPTRPNASKSRKAPTPKPAPSPAPASTDTHDLWTRVESRRRKESQQPGPPDAGTSDVGVTTTSITGNSSPTAPHTDDEEPASGTVSMSDNRRTLAEKLLPKPRKTGVDEFMLETPDYPSVASVVRIQPGPNERPATGFTWGDYEDVDDPRTADDADGEDDGGWGVVKSRSRSKTHKTVSESAASEQQTQKQRQNAAKREASKAARAELQVQQEARLAQHRREQERARIAEQYKNPGKNLSGGMTAYVDENGKLVWK